MSEIYANTFNLLPSIKKIHLFYFPLRTGYIFLESSFSIHLSVNNACSNPMFGFISHVRARTVISLKERAVLNEDLWIRRYESLFLVPSASFKTHSGCRTFWNDANDSRAITFCRLIAFCILQLVHHVEYN